MPKCRVCNPNGEAVLPHLSACHKQALELIEQLEARLARADLRQAPKVYQHGTGSFVLEWSLPDDETLNLTVSATYASILRSNKAGIIYREEYPIETAWARAVAVLKDAPIGGYHG